MMPVFNKASFLDKCLQQVAACTMQKAESGKHVNMKQTAENIAHSTMPIIRSKASNPPQHRRYSGNHLAKHVHRSSDISNSKESSFQKTLNTSQIVG